MKAWMIRGASCVAVAMILALPGCSQTKSECDCAAPGHARIAG